ncbi:MAG: hypothetical protein ACJA0N_000513 [Pseudohongiellaceae bacterium]|jgi:hypothetical protein
MACKPLLLSFYLLAFCPLASADNFYSELSVLYTTTKFDGLSFSQTAAQARGGMYILPQIGIEIYASKGIDDDSNAGLTTEFDYNTGIDIRLETPEQKRAKLFVTLGYSQTAISMSKQDSDFPGKETFRSPSVGIGYEVRAGRDNNISILGKYTYFYDDDEIRISGFNLGAKYEF